MEFGGLFFREAVHMGGIAAGERLLSVLGWPSSDSGALSRLPGETVRSGMSVGESASKTRGQDAFASPDGLS